MKLVLPVFGLLFAVGAAQPQSAPYDLVIHGGRIVDA